MHKNQQNAHKMKKYKLNQGHKVVRIRSNMGIVKPLKSL